MLDLAGPASSMTHHYWIRKLSSSEVWDSSETCRAVFATRKFKNRKHGETLHEELCRATKAPTTSFWELSCHMTIYSFCQWASGFTLTLVEFSKRSTQNIQSKKHADQGVWTPRSASILDRTYWKPAESKVHTAHQCLTDLVLWQVFLLFPLQSFNKTINCARGILRWKQR